jgi:hypothetical protein
MERAVARKASEGLKTKVEMICQYLTGLRFRHRVEAIVDAFPSMKEDLTRKRRRYRNNGPNAKNSIVRVMQSTRGMCRDLQGIAGKTIQEIGGLVLAALEVPSSLQEETQ